MSFDNAKDYHALPAYFRMPIFEMEQALDKYYKGDITLHS